jgi:16S rRNA (cytidine1402-2'-O)-methyltransferase
MPNLYVVATPIGNLEDLSLRALRLLREVTLIAAEDTRTTKRLLNAYDIKTPLTSYYEHNKLAKLETILAALQNGDVALVSEAGMPGISDPGYELIAEAGRRGIPVVPVPGPSAAVTALAVSGLPTDRFTFAGFLPGRAAARRRALEELAEEPGTLVLYEAPHRLAAALQDILTVLGDRRLAVGRELTKLHEEVFRGTVSEALRHFTAPRGEFTLVIEGRGSRGKPGVTADAAAELARLKREGTTAKEAVAAVAGATGLPRRQLYKTWLALGKSGGPDRGNNRGGLT